ncbi:MAG TPA: hypothetical protein VL442_20590 [Mucilaginibacter sp.]|nr:hypothetical protein [Mucilaginibacter sp.]
MLKWLVKKDHIEYLKAKSNAAVFYNKDLLTKQTIIDNSDKTVPKVCMKDFLSADEIKTCETAPPKLMQTDWRKHYSKLKTQFVTDEFETNKLRSNEPYTIFGFSEPIFLNKTNTRVIIGEYFFCGPACGRDDLLLCEFKNGSWQILARAIISND